MKVGNVDSSFWKDKKVFLTGHTGFKGGWLSFWLTSMGAKVTGYALAPNTVPSLFDVLSIGSLIEESHIGDVRDLRSLQSAMSKVRPDVVIHMAAQALVRYSYINPVETYATNIMGTVNLLESIRSVNSVRATVIVTTDKCYENKEWVWGYRECESIGGRDPYSSSKGCAELVTSAYRQSYFSAVDNINMVATARAGNVVGGGDWSVDRLIPDAIKAFEAGKPVIIRNPTATRPWQHVLEPLSGYLILAQELYERGADFSSSWNFGPADEDNRSVQDVLNILIDGWGESASWKKGGGEQLHEAGLLKLDCSKSRAELGWMPKWGLPTAIQKVIQWEKAFRAKKNMQDVTLLQINEYQTN